MRSRFWVALDVGMLASTAFLAVWRLTGLVLHEWLGVFLIFSVLAHVLLHWKWIATRSRRILAQGSARTRVNFALNLTLFVAMALTLLSGVVISKVVLPHHPVPADYITWHSMHDASSRIALVCVGLHLGLNWELMVAGLRKLRRRGREGERPSGLRPQVLRPLAAPLLIILTAVSLLAAAAFAVERMMPAPDITLVERGRGRIEHAPLPPPFPDRGRSERLPSTRGFRRSSRRPPSWR